MSRVTNFQMCCVQKIEKPSSLSSGSAYYVVFDRPRIGDVTAQSSITIEIFDRKQFENFVVGADYSVVMQRIAADT